MLRSQIALSTLGTTMLQPPIAEAHGSNGVMGLIYGNVGTRQEWRYLFLPLCDDGADSARPARYHHPRDRFCVLVAFSPTGAMPVWSSNVSRVDCRPFRSRPVQAEVLPTWRWPEGCESCA